jgi:hypothetical protein
MRMTDFTLLFLSLCILIGCSGARPFDTLVFSDDFDEFDLSVWGHELTLGGGG